MCGWVFSSLRVAREDTRAGHRGGQEGGQHPCGDCHYECLWLIQHAEIRGILCDAILTDCMWLRCLLAGMGSIVHMCRVNPTKLEDALPSFVNKFVLWGGLAVYCLHTYVYIYWALVRPHTPHKRTGVSLQELGTGDKSSGQKHKFSTEVSAYRDSKCNDW